MILPNFRPPYLTPIAIKGSSTTPAGVNWGNINFTASSGTHSITEQRITGIGSPIVLSMNGVWGAGSKLYYRVGPTPTTVANPVTNIDFSGPFDYTVGFGSSSLGYTAALPYNDSTGSFTVNNNDYVSFMCWGSDPPGPVGYPTWTVTIKNESDNQAILDTFDAITNS
jgi:hypothetical protein